MSQRVSYVRNVRLKVDKETTLADESFCLSLSGLRAGQKITLHTSAQLPNAAIFESSSHYIADDHGNVELTRDKSHGGSFKGVEPMGPISFMVASATNKRKYEQFFIKEPAHNLAVNFHVLDSFVDSLDEVLAKNVHKTPPNLTITRLYMSPGVKEIPVWDGRIRGTLFIPAGDGPFPGLISMSGGFPGAMKYKAALLASRGFVAIALKYFGEDDLPDDFHTVDLDYVEEAAVFLRNHSKVDGRNGVGIIAHCYGAVVAFYMATYAPKGLIGSLVAVNGWFITSNNFTYKGDILPTSQKLKHYFNYTADGVLEWKCILHRDDDTDFRPALESSPAFYERHDTAYMIVAGTKDAHSETNYLVAVAEHLLRTHKHPNYEILRYEGAGHFLEHSFNPHSSIRWTFKKPHYMGGEQPGHSIAQNDSWPKILEFTRKNLMGHKTQQSKL